ncbi:phospholipase C/P1 nuclease domain-containing protein [Massariosphaeria phaeospora]|uniref:Phospholipase C/P1 nuclease domain-containing protein n=1 Tax=Massariosphaeria phaeospora TaxID=100035 RepID=A0A7C8I4J0_9PLEO|nr:phospholipase C/P1 nuclease domain-containing protein [Massariosphaeria phaeospora]
MFTNDVLLGSLLFASVAAWNTDVHNQIGFMAETFLHPHTTSILRTILEPQYNGSIGRAAAWADGFAHTDEGRFSYQWHWIDAHDQPPETCSLNYTRDCAKGGCVVSAIANQTQILKGCIEDVKSGSLTRGTNLTCSYALKWVTHFFGDIAQPLHASGRAAGGNFFNVTFGGVATELHAVWDGYIPYTAAKVTSPFSNQSIDPFFEGLLSRIRKDQFLEAPYMWLSCSDPAIPIECATQWARESNKWTCDYVYSRVSNLTDLASDGYAAGGVPIVELQISKAALRLATWLNKLVGAIRHHHTQQIIII